MEWKEHDTLDWLAGTKPSLWDMIDSEYAKHEVREVAYKKIAEKLGENWVKLLDIK